MVDGMSGIQPLNDPRLSRQLKVSWDHYRKTMIDAADGRPLCDKDGNDIDGDGDTSERQTFSEGVSYVLLRAVEMNDQKTFARAWSWAKNNMQRKNIDKVYYWNQEKWITPPKKDNLFCWRYIPSLEDKKGGVIHYDWIANDTWRGCFEAASDADVDIAAALAMAGEKWNNADYMNEAKNLLKDIWDGYVKKVGSHYYLFGGDQFKSMGEVNPSYMRPAYFKSLFPKIDPSHPWKELYRSSYKVIVESGDITLNGEDGKVNLPPNWIDVTPAERFVDSDIFLSQGGHLFGWDAFRTLFAVAQDYAWNGTSEARKYLTDKSGTSKDAGPYAFLKKELDAKGEIVGGFDRDGSPAQTAGLDREQFTMYGAYLPFFYYGGDGKASKKIMEILNKMYSEEGYWGDDPKNYYGQNWVWFGLALINGEAVVSSQSPKEAAQSVKETGQSVIEETEIQQVNPDLKIKNAPKQQIDLAKWWNFDGGVKNPDNTIAFKGQAKGWYLGGAGGMLNGIASYTGILLNVEGVSGKIKIELYGKNGKKYISETLASAAKNLYIPFESFREEVNFQPSGESFSKSTDAEKMQVIAIGTSETSPIDFTLREVYLIDYSSAGENK